MRRHFSYLMVRVGRWPRRIAAATCLLLAAVNAVGGHTSAPRDSTSARLETRLPPGEVAASVTTSADLLSFVRVGDRVDLMAAPADDATDSSATTIGTALPVLQVGQSGPSIGDDSSTLLVVAATHEQALAIASAHGRQIVAVVGRSP